MTKIIPRQVTSTNDYSLFVMHPQNRSIVGPEGYVPRKDLIASIRQHGFLQSAPISCAMQPDGKLLIIDGHNRFIAAKHLNSGVWYVAFPEGATLSPADYNKNNRAWKLVDFTSGYAHEDADYAEVVAFHERTGIPASACFAMFGGEIASSGNANRTIRGGKFKIKNREHPHAVESIACVARSFCDFASSKPFITAVSRAVYAEGFDPAKMADRIYRKKELLKKCSTSGQYEELLETIYNHSVKGERLYLKAEIEKAMRRRNAVTRRETEVTK